MLVCPVCSASFRVQEGELGPRGRIVGCSKCDHEWLAHVSDILPAPGDASHHARTTHDANLADNTIQHVESSLNGSSSSALNTHLNHLSLDHEHYNNHSNTLSPSSMKADSVNFAELPKASLLDRAVKRGQNAKIMSQCIDNQQFSIASAKRNSVKIDDSSIHFIIIFVILNILAFSGIIAIEYWDVLQSRFPILENLDKQLFPNHIQGSGLKIIEYSVTEKEDRHFITFRIENTSSTYHVLSKLRVLGFDNKQEQIAESIIPLNTPLYPGMYKNISVTLTSNLMGVEFFSLYINDILLLDNERYRR